MSDLREILEQQARARGYSLGGLSSSLADLLQTIGRLSTAGGAAPAFVPAPANNQQQQQNQQPNQQPAIQPLQHGDYDSKNGNYRYDGTQAQHQAGNTYTEVDTLQDNLRAIGLDDIVGAADGDYGSRTTIAVAIFQGFALLKTQQDAANNAANPMNFTGAVTGHADTVTRTALRRYVNENIALPVQDLENRLTTFGFGDLFGTADATYTWATYFAVREFQIAAAMGQVAEAPQNLAQNTPLGDQYTQVQNTQQYTGPINGVLDTVVNTCMDTWENNRWRCPVIFEAWNMQNGNRNTLVEENFWKHDSMTNANPRVFARDMSGYYTLPAARQNDTHHVVGQYTTYGTWEGPVSLPRYDQTWSPEAEFLPESCTGNNWNAMTAAQQSTFRAIRAICERESLGYFDCLNAYDRAVVSAGPYHWTLCIMDSNAPHRPGNGELMAFLAMLRNDELATYNTFFEHFGVRPDNAWGAHGAEQFNDSAHKYSDWIQFQISANLFVSAPKLATIGHYFRSWPWFYRIQMMCRTSDEVQQLMWTYARMRMRDIRETVWDNTATVDDGNGGTRLAKIGDYYTSEKALAMLTRWHVWSPGSIVSGGVAGQRLRTAFQNANLNGDPSTWTDANEVTLTDAVRQAGRNHSAGLGDGLDAIDDWPNSMATNRNFTLNTNTTGDIDGTRNSLDLDTTGLPTQAF